MDNDLETVAKHRVQARMGFVVHAVIFFAMNAGFVLIWLLTGHGYPWFLWPIVCWGIGLVAHAITLLIGPDSAGEQRAIDRELRRLRSAHH